MNIGFDTIGNATIVCYDKVPMLVTDPWIAGSAYFGSLADYRVGFQSGSGEMLPAFIRYDCETDALTEINPEEKRVQVLSAAEFGDDWGERLERMRPGRSKGTSDPSNTYGSFSISSTCAWAAPTQ